MKKNIKKVFDEIEKIRSKNNKNWMNLLRLLYDVKPKETIEIINQILNKDEKLISLAKKLSEVGGIYLVEIKKLTI